MKSFNIILILGFLFFISSCSKKVDNVTDPVINNPVQTSKTEFSGKVNVNNAGTTIGINNVIDVKIPQGAFSGDATFTIKVLDKQTLPASTDYSFLEAFEISSSGGSTFLKNIEISFKYDATKGEKLAAKNGVAFYHETAQKWIRFQDVTIDTLNTKIVLNTNHLTKISRFNPLYWAGYTHSSNSLHFKIYWSEPGVFDNKEYNSPYKMTAAGTDPYYIQDILRYLEDSWTVYNNAKITLPSSKIEVYVKELPKGTDGTTSFLGAISINQKLEGSAYALPEETLPMVCAHELFHYVQDYYYMQLFSDYTIKWWLEASAVIADQYVWPNHKKFEIIEYSENLHNILNAPWDECNSDPNYYIAGSFLSYLAYYRTGKKIDLAQLMREGGNEKNVSLMRTFLDNFIKANLGSAGVGEEYRNFVKWVFERTGAIKLNVARPTLTPVFSNFKNSILSTKYDVFQMNSQIPRLSTVFFKGMNYTKVRQTMIVTMNQKSVQADAYLYKVNTNGTVTFLKQLNEKDSLKFELEDKEWGEVVTINKTKEENGTAAVTFKFETTPAITSILPAKASPGDAVTIKGSNFGDLSSSTSRLTINNLLVNLVTQIKSWSDNEIVFTVPSEAQSGSVTVEVQKMQSNKVNLEVVVVPVIESVLMKQGFPNFPLSYPWGWSSNTITISGKNWSMDAAKTNVIINNGLNAQISGLFADRITIVTPALKGNVQVVVESNGVKSQPKNFFIGLPSDVLQKMPFMSFTATFNASYVNPDHAGALETYPANINGNAESVQWNGNTMTVVNKFTYPDGFVQKATLIMVFSADGLMVNNLDFTVDAYNISAKFKLNDLPLSTVQNGYNILYSLRNIPKTSYGSVTGSVMHSDDRKPHPISGLVDGSTQWENKFILQFDFKNP